MLEAGEGPADRAHLAEALRTLRRASGLSGERLADKTGMSQSKISKIETGKLVPSLVDVERWVQALQVDPDFARELLDLAKVANVQFRSIRESQRWGWHNRQRELAAMEQSCKRLRYFLPSMITGLLQTAAYARQTTVDEVSGESSADSEDIVARKLGRQRVLYDNGRQFTFLFTEAALRWRLVADAEMAEQLDKVVSLAGLSAVSVEVIPARVRVPGCPLNVFTVYDERLATAETVGGLVVMRDPLDVRYLSGLFDFFSSHALKGGEARDFIRAIAEEFRSSEQNE